MVKKLLFLTLILQLTSSFSQERDLELFGSVSIDSISSEGIHIINTSSNKATLTNQYGDFRIVAKENDTLLFTSIQIKNKKTTITKEHLKNLQLSIKLEVDINQLDEVIIKKHNLTGSIYQDVTNTNLKNHVDEFTLKLPNAGNKPTTEIGFIKLRYGQFSGVIGSLYGWISGEKKKLKKIEKLATEDFYIKKINDFITPLFFVNELKIPKGKTFHFLEFCKPKGIIKLYREKKLTELIKILEKESKLYLKTFRNEK